jgi:hypothetical protein
MIRKFDSSADRALRCPEVWRRAFGRFAVKELPKGDAAVVSPLLLLAIIYLISQSKKRGEAMGYVLATMILTFVVGLGIGHVNPTTNAEAVGSATVPVMLLVGLLTALIYYRKGKV